MLLIISTGQESGVKLTKLNIDNAWIADTISRITWCSSRCGDVLPCWSHDTEPKDKRHQVNNLDKVWKASSKTSLNNNDGISV